MSMISVRCPACGKVIGFEESDAGSLVACPLCRQSFFVPVIAQPATPGATSSPAAAPPAVPPVAARLPLEPTLPDPDEIRIVADPDLDPVLQQCDDLQLADEPPPPGPSPELPVEVPVPEPALPPPEPIPQMEIDPPRTEEIETVEPIGTPKQVEPTDLAPSLAAAEVLSESLPETKKSDRPTDVLEEVDDEDDVEVIEEEERPRRKAKRSKSEYRKPYHAQPARPEGLTRNRVMGGIGTGMGGMILLGTLAHHLTASQNAWHGGVCCADVFALALAGVGLFYLIRG
jgi:hypothetical protein